MHVDSQRATTTKVRVQVHQDCASACGHPCFEPGVENTVRRFDGDLTPADRSKPIEQI